MAGGPYVVAHAATMLLFVARRRGKLTKPLHKSMHINIIRVFHV